MLRVALVSLNYQKRGGIERYVREISKILQHKLELHVYTTDVKDIINNSKGKDYQKIKFHLIKIPKFLHPAIQTLLFCGLVSVKLFFKRYDIIHNHTAGLFIKSISTFHSVHIAMLRMASAGKKPTLLAKLLSYIYSLDEIKNYHIRLGSFIICLLHKVGMCHKNRLAVITHNKGCANEIAKYYKISPDEITIIPSGIDIDRFNPLLRRSRQNNEFKNYLVLIFVSNRFKEKNLPLLIEALSYLRQENVKLLVVGEDSFLPYEEEIKEKKLEDKVIYVGSVGNLEEYYAQADVLVHPAPWGWFELVVYEALACGIPVLATKIYGVEEVVKDKINGFFIKLKAEDIADKIRFILNNKEILEAMREDARNSVINYTFDQTAELSFRLYEKIKNKKIKR